MARWPGFCGPSYVSQSSVILGERTINLYPAPMPGEAKTRTALYPTPGTGGDVWTFGTGGATRCTGLFAQDGRAFATSDVSFVELIDGGGAMAVIGSIASTPGRQAQMASSGVGGHQLAIASGRSLYIYDLTSGVFSGPINDTGGNPIVSDAVLFLDGYFISLNTTAQTFQLSALFNGLAWDPLDVAQSTASSDRWVSMSKSNRTLWLIGSQTAQPWYNNGDSDFPFAPFEGGFVETGCAAIDSVRRFGQEDSGPIFLSQNESGGYSFRHLVGYTPQRISTEGQEYLISQYADVSDAVAFTYADQGQDFYVCVFPGANAGWAWSPQSGWHERLIWMYNTFNPYVTGWNAPKLTSHCFAFGSHIIGASYAAAALQYSVNFLDDIGRRQRITPILSREGGMVPIPRITLDLEVGLGLSQDDNRSGAITRHQYDPAMIMLSLSRDGGKTYGNERSRSGGGIGQYSTRVYWDRNGQGRSVVGNFIFSDLAPYRIANCYLGDVA